MILLKMQLDRDHICMVFPPSGVYRGSVAPRLVHQGLALSKILERIGFANDIFVIQRISISVLS